MCDVNLLGQGHVLQDILGAVGIGELREEHSGEDEVHGWSVSACPTSTEVHGTPSTQVRLDGDWMSLSQASYVLGLRDFPISV